MPLDLELRRSGISSTNVGAVLGVDPDRDMHAVWAVNVGGLIPPPPTWSMRLGTFLEHAVIDIYADWASNQEAYSGKKVEPLFNKTFRHPKFPHVLASPDALVGDDAGADAKTSNFFQRHQWGETADDIPDKVQLQMVVCMEVMDRDRWDIALLSGDQFRVIGMQRDREFGGYVCNEVEKIWQIHFSVKDNPPPIGGSKASTAWLKQAFPRNRLELRVATDDEIRELRLYGRLRADQEVLKKERERMENWLKNRVMDCDGLIWEHGKFTWKRANDANKVRWQALAEALLTAHVRLPDGSARDEEAIKVLYAAYTFKEPGVRRIHFRSDETFGEVEETSDAA